jgi:hypothetical protein
MYQSLTTARLARRVPSPAGADIDGAEVARQRLEIRERNGAAESQRAIGTVLADILDLVGAAPP